MKRAPSASDEASQSEPRNRSTTFICQDSPPAAGLRSPAPAPVATGPSVADIEEWLKTGSSKWSQDELIAAIIKLDPKTHPRLFEALADKFRENPEAMFGFIEALAGKWAEQAPGPATQFLSRLHGKPGIIPLERRLMNDWVARDFKGVGEYLQRSSQEGTPNMTQLAFLTGIVQHEQKEKLGDLLDWVDGLKGEENRMLQGEAAHALARLGEPENFHKIAAVMDKNLENLSVASYAGIMAGNRVADHPDEALDWLHRLPAGPARYMMAEYVTLALGQSDPERAVELFNSPEFDKFLDDPPPPDTGYDDPDAPAKSREERRQEHRDELLKAFLNAVMSKDPEYALLCAKQFKDPVIQAEYTKMALGLMEAPATNDKTQPETHHE